MTRAKNVTAIEEGERALTQLLSRLPEGDVTTAIRRYVGRLRQLAIQPRKRSDDPRIRLLQAIADAETDYLAAKADKSHQAADRTRRHKLDLEAQLAELDSPRPVRARSQVADPNAGRIPWLERHLLEIEADLDYLRQSEQWSLIPPLDARACALRDELDEARGMAGQRAPLDRSPGAIAAEILRRGDRLRELAEAERRAVEEDDS